MAGTDSDGTKSRAYLKFDTSPLVGQQISNVTLSLLNIDGPSCGSQVSDGIQVRRVTSRWSPATVTWAEQPTNTTENAVTNRSSVGGSCAPTPMTWDITTIAKQWATDVGNYGLVLMSPTERAARNHRVYPSSEDSDFNDPPKLTATFSKVTDIAWKIDMKSEDGSKTETVRWVQVGKKRGKCVIDGDSGGPVYTFRPDGSVVAKGVTSGSNADLKTPVKDTCVHTFTDFHDVTKAVGKDIYKR